MAIPLDTTGRKPKPQAGLVKYPALKFAAATPTSGGGGGLDIAGLLASVNRPLDTTGIAKTAASRAAAETSPIVDALRAQQAGIIAQAQQQARDITRASTAAGNFERSLNLGGRLADALRQAGGDQASLAAGLSGDLRSTVNQEAAQVQNALNTIGGAGTLPNTTTEAGNTVFNLGGRLPASALLASAPFAQAQADQAPANLAAYGQQQAFGALGAGRKEAAALNTDIAKAIAGRPALAAKYADTLTSQAMKARAASDANVWKAVGASQKADQAAALKKWRQAQLDKPVYQPDGHGGRIQIDPKTNKVTQVSYGPSLFKPDGRGGTLEIDPYTGKVSQFSKGPVVYKPDGRGGQVAIDPYTGKQQQAVYGPPVTRSDGHGGTISVDQYTGKVEQLTTGPPKWQKVTDAKGTYLIDPDTMTKVRVAGPSGSAASANRPKLINAPDGSKWIVRSKPDGTLTFQQAPGKLGQPRPHTNTANKISATTVNELATDLRSWHTGVTGTSNGQPVIDEGSKLNWSQAYTRAAARLPDTPAGRKKALTLTNAEFGTPQDIATKNVLADKQQGSSLMEAITNVLDALSQGQLPVPLAYAVDALAKLYQAPRKIVLRYMNDVASGTAEEHGSPAYG